MAIDTDETLREFDHAGWSRLADAFYQSLPESLSPEERGALFTRAKQLAGSFGELAVKAMTPTLQKAWVAMERPEPPTVPTVVMQDKEGHTTAVININVPRPGKASSTLIHNESGRTIGSETTYE